MIASLDSRTTALVLIDLQQGVVSLPCAPRPGEQVVANAAHLAAGFRAANAPVVLVHASPIADGSDRLHSQVDEPVLLPGTLPGDFFDIVAGVRGEQDILVVKRQWGAFYGTDLDLQLRRRGLSTVVLGGLLTNFGVEATARSAWEHAYDVVVVEDAMAALSTEDHAFAVNRIFPRIARVATTQEVLSAIEPS